MLRYCIFSTDCDNIFLIGQYLAKIWTKVTFLQSQKNTMSVTLRVSHSFFILLVTSAILFGVQIVQYSSDSFARSKNKRNRNFQVAGSPCFTVGFTLPRGGLGNYLFFYSGVMYVAWLTGRTPVVLTKKYTKLDKAFDLDIAREDKNNRCPARIFRYKYIYGYDTGIKNLISVKTNVSIHLDGNCFSWKYTQPIEHQLRQRLRFRRELTVFAEKFLSNNIPRGWDTLKFVRVGIHVRRGDFLSRWAIRIGLTVASKEYVYQAMTYFVKRYHRVQFVVASNDIAWCETNIKSSSINKQRVNITFSIGHSAEQDLTLLASCDHTIMTTGTYGWWASWLANGTTVYYNILARRGTEVWRRSRVADHFPPTWIGMNETRNF